jgi:hypothetical protein
MKIFEVSQRYDSERLYDSQNKVDCDDGNEFRRQSLRDSPSSNSYCKTQRYIGDTSELFEVGADDDEEFIPLLDKLFDLEEEKNWEDCFDLSASNAPHFFDQGGNDNTDVNDSSAAPAYLIKAILAGLYELPPPHILKYQLGLGRRVRYDSVVRLESHFLPLEGRSADLERMRLTRQFDTSKAASFYVYRRTLLDCENLNTTLRVVALAEELKSAGLDVSNAGGSWHGPPNFLSQRNLDDTYSRACLALYSFFADSVQQIDPHQNHVLDLEPSNIECWINTSRNGSWNRLHTHEGSAWSAVYYVDAGSPQTTTYGGRLVLKPSPHPREDTHTLDVRERERFFDWRDLDPDWSIVEYVDLDAVPGSMLIFPSWLHHCVLPTVMTESPSHPRISIAFNVNWMPKQKCGRV